MKIRHTLIALAAAFALAGGTNVLAAEPHAHAAGEPTRLALDHGKKWSTDEPLRKNMSEIRAALAAKEAGIHRGTLTSDDYKALGLLIETRVSNIVAELLAGADAMQGKTEAKPAAGAAQAARAANQYGRYFSHPGWKPLA